MARRIDAVLGAVADATTRAGRAPSSVRLVAVSKTAPAELVQIAYDCGLRVFGENRAQELEAKARRLPTDVEWHMIGPVQTNKVRRLAPIVSLWHSLDRHDLAVELARRAPGAPVLVEVNVGGESAKAGCSRADVDALVDDARALGLDVRGLMCVPPALDDPAPHFAWMQRTADRLGVTELSMGMSGDFATAIEHGATYVRIGTALFGPRPAPGAVRN